MEPPSDRGKAMSNSPPTVDLELGVVEGHTQNVTEDTAVEPQNSRKASFKGSLKRIPTTFGGILPFSGASRITDDRYDHFISYKLEDFPDGYPRLAAFLNSDIDTRLYRRFGYLRNRLLLHRQDELSYLEARLARLDKQHEASDPYRLQSRRYDEADAEGQKRIKLLQKVDEKLKDYDELIMREHAVMNLPQTSRKSHKANFDHVFNEKPVDRDEYQFMYHKDDFITLGMPEDSWLGSFVDFLNAATPERLKNFLMSSRSSQQKWNGDGNLQFYSNSRTETIVKGLVALVSTLLLIIPVVLLYFLTVTGGVKVGIILIFMVAFSVALSTMTNAKRHEIFGAAAAYCAVLVVFLGNLPLQN